MHINIVAPLPSICFLFVFFAFDQQPIFHPKQPQAGHTAEQMSTLTCHRCGLGSLHFYLWSWKNCQKSFVRWTKMPNIFKWRLRETTTHRPPGRFMAFWPLPDKQEWPDLFVVGMILLRHTHTHSCKWRETHAVTNHYYNPGHIFKHDHPK